MDLDLLRNFLVVAECSNITRAAARCYITQPALTKQLQALEQEFGTPLLERAGHGVRLTDAGETLRDHARQTLALLHECRDRLGDLAVGRAGTVAVGAGVTTCIYQLPAWLEALQQRHPGIDVTVHTGESHETAALVLAREIDLGLVTSPVRHAQLDVSPLYDEEIVLVGRSDIARAARRDPAAAAYILFPSGSGFRAFIDATLAGSGLVPHAKMVTDSVEAMKGLAGAGLGLAFLPRVAVAPEIQGGALVTLKLPGHARLMRTTSLIVRRDRHLGVAAATLIELMTQSRRRRAPA